MKRFTLFAVIILLLLLIPVGVLAMGNINIITSPPNAIVRIDGMLNGTTPVNLSATSGTHLVTLSLNPYADYSTNVNVVNKSTITVTYTFQNPAPTISSITPQNGFNNSAVSITNLAGNNFISGATVVLNMSGQPNIPGQSVSVTSATQMACTFDITGKPAGSWNVIVTNPDGQSGTLTNGFLVKNPTTTATLTSITPASGETNTTVSITDLKGTGFASSATMLLRRSSSNDIHGTISSVNSAGTDIIGSFILTNRLPGDYQVCVYNDASMYICGLTFTITSDFSSANGSINVKSSPSGGKVFIKNYYKGYTPITLENITPGTYTVTVLRTGYTDYYESVKVTAANVSSINAYLELLPESTTVVTTTATPVKTVVTTIKKSTLKVPTTWPSATATEASPVDPVVIVGAVGIGLGLVVIRRR